MRYHPAGKCIYCGAERNPNGDPLGEEHIIPLSFGGNLILPQASCRECEAVINKFETHCLEEMLSTARPHLGIRGRQRRDFNLKGPVYIQENGRITTKSVPIDEHPGGLMVPVMPVAKLILNPNLALVETCKTPEAVTAFCVSMTADLGPRTWKIDKRGLYLCKKGLSGIEFCRMLSKIAHSYSAAELGVDAFYPLLRNIIFLELPMYVDYFVGSEAAKRRP